MTVFRANSAARFTTPLPALERDIAELDRKLRLLRLIPGPRQPGTWARMDALLDERNALRPARPLPLRRAVPVIPGRTS